jgi:hypothetical protein
MESSSRPSEYEEKVVSIIHLFMVYLMMLSVTQTILVYWTQTGKVTYIRALCQNNEGSVEIKQRPIKMDGRLFTGHCHLKGHLFKLGLTDDPTCERCLKEDESDTHILCDCEAIDHLRFRHLGQFFTETSDYYDAPIIKVLHFIQSVGLIRG